MNRWAPRLIAIATLVAGGAAAVYYSHAGPRAHALRRARPPRGRASHPRQPHARLAADRRRLASPPPRPEHAPRPGGRVVPDGRVGDRDLGRVDGRRRVGARVAHHRTHRVDRRRRRRRGAAPREPERALSPEHADDRAAALRDDAAGGGADGGLARSRRRGCAEVSGARARGRVHDAVRSLADLRQPARPRAGGASAPGHTAAERGRGGREAGGLPGDRGRALPAQQPVDGRRVVRQQRLLRRGERGPGPPARRVGAGARGGLSPLRAGGRLAGVRGRGLDRVGLRALAGARVTRARPGARRRRRVAVVRVLRRPPLSHPLRRTARGRVRGARRDGDRPPAAPRCAPSPPSWRSRARCGRSRRSIDRRRSSPNRSGTRRISSDDAPSPRTSDRITMAARS